ncbi:helix-turn-helix domain-containing protein [Burkholderia sp. AU28942]|uniref:helix-turn-helix domain-containing protein n=1 Tax=Burkholderia sp. AU28942 TaxID=2879626 RepID=UPI000AD2DF2B|nr:MULTISPECIES: helix-turn-helix domain-containing protein [Burkholderia]MCA8310866.1 helix-turn-helix domain-containing protein [Burkholderia sp. AU28942]
MRKYKHLSAEERSVIVIEHRNGSSTRAIALRLGRSASTVSRELARNGDTATHYDATRRHRRTVLVVKDAAGGASCSLAAHCIDMCITGWSIGAGRRSRLLPDFAVCIPTILTSAPATKRFTLRYTLIREADSSRR